MEVQTRANTMNLHNSAVTEASAPAVDREFKSEALSHTHMRSRAANGWKAAELDRAAETTKIMV